MRNRLRLSAAILSFLLGVAHLAYSAVLYDSLTLNALWFVGTGLAVICVALNNLLEPSNSLRGKFINAVQNMTMAAYFVVVLTILPAPQVIIGIMLFSILLVISLIDFRARRSI